MTKFFRNKRFYKQNERICHGCGENIQLAESFFMLYVPTPPGGDHFRRHAWLWHFGLKEEDKRCLTIGQLLRLEALREVEEEPVRVQAPRRKIALVASR